MAALPGRTTMRLQQDTNEMAMPSLNDAGTHSATQPTTTLQLPSYPPSFANIGCGLPSQLDSMRRRVTPIPSGQFTSLEIIAEDKHESSTQGGSIAGSSSHLQAVEQSTAPHVGRSGQPGKKAGDSETLVMTGRRRGKSKVVASPIVISEATTDRQDRITRRSVRKAGGIL